MYLQPQNDCFAVIHTAWKFVLALLKHDFPVVDHRTAGRIIEALLRTEANSDVQIFRPVARAMRLLRASWVESLGTE
jgi:hypothetical protein